MHAIYRPMIPQLLRLLTITLSVGLVAGCLTPSMPTVNYGIQSGREGFVPARMAIVPCQVWPTSSRFRNYLPPNVGSASLAQICERFDQEVLSAFERQPFMKGYSPRFVRAALEKANRGGLLGELTQLWTVAPPSCDKALSAPQCYQVHIRSLPAWNIWLSQVSEATRHSDALLIPFVTVAREQRSNVRGLHIAERTVTVDLFLVSTNRGELVWVGGRSVSDSNKRLASGEPLEGLPYPEWDHLLPLLFSAALWRDFPGRLVL